MAGKALPGKAPWWFQTTDTYDDVKSIVLKSDNLSPAAIDQSLEDALQKAQLLKPSLVPHISRVLMERQRRHQWQQGFDDLRSRCPLADRALLRLEKANVDRPSMELLWEYAQDHTYFKETQRGIALIVRHLQSFRRAEREEKRRVNDSRAELFRKRREKAASVLAQTPWPFRNPELKTFGDALRSRPELSDLRKTRGLIGRSGLTFLLAMLRAGARSHGVTLSANEIATLAYCATGTDHDSGTLRRYLRQAWIHGAEPDYQDLFDHPLVPIR